MKKKNYLSLLVTLTALGVVGSLHTPSVQADGGEADKSLLPVVFMTIDTSGSMNGSMGADGNTRFTQAIQELSGKAKLANPATISYNQTRFPR
ncbi:MAG: hypothetical protein IIY06_05975 [Proteobacteria bacterium]|nr:hypothetical protein [Pseudomonadota bacterium]